MTYIDISGDGTINLGDKVTCDGFQYDFPLRIQSHIHFDHMDDFDCSKGFQDIIMSEASKDLLVAEKNADLPIRSNIKSIPLNEKYRFQNLEVELLDSGHMLGSVQVAVVLPNGVKCGYSGDFNWPITHVISVDELVVDSTYGSPESVRKYSQEEAENALLEIVSKGLKLGPVYIKAHKGTLERAITCLNGIFKCPIIASPVQYKSIGIYQKYGYDLTEVIESNDELATSIIMNGQYIKLCGHYEISPINVTSVILSAYHSGMTRPFTEYSNKSFAISLTNHADYVGTLEYVVATGAKFVITDNYRGGKGIELALSIESELGIKAIASEIKSTYAWGM
jgi:putative mRNA 3-end processing factor